MIGEGFSKPASRLGPIHYAAVRCCGLHFIVEICCDLGRPWDGASHLGKSTWPGGRKACRPREDDEAL